jgi:hypothetical protein
MILHHYICGHHPDAAPWADTVGARQPLVRVAGFEYRPAIMTTPAETFEVVAPAGVLIELAWLDLAHSWHELGPPTTWLQFESGTGIPEPSRDTPTVFATAQGSLHV